MGLFPSSKDFKDGPGVEKDAPRKTGVGRFFELVGRDMSGMFLANLLTCLGFLPVICLVYIGFLMNSLPVMVLSAAVGGILAAGSLAVLWLASVTPTGQLGVTAVAKNLDCAIEKAYAAVSLISFQDAHYRRDIGIK